jgi:hypothetical protein
MKSLWSDDRGEMMGTGIIAGTLLLATFFMGIFWIVVTPFIYLIVGFVNMWIGGGWVTEQSAWELTFFLMAWLSLPALCFFGFIEYSIVKSMVLKERVI